MVIDYVKEVLTLFRNMTLNSVGVERDLFQHIEDGDIDYVLSLFDDNDSEVDKALEEYNPQLHRVMFRPNKYREHDEPYISEKLPRTRQRYINEVELFFLLGNPIVWTKEEGTDEAYKLFQDFLSDTYFNERMRTAKRLAGAETECAKLYRVYNDNKNGKLAMRTDVIIIARTTGYKLRPLFDQYGVLQAFAVGYKLRKGKEASAYHWDIYTTDFIFECTHKAIGWKVVTKKNPLGKIPVIYYRQLKSWDGVQARINREEMLDSKIGDTNNYFADPMAQATADVIDSLADPDKPGKLIQLTSSASKFEYINPPTSSELRTAEKAELNKSILFDSFTPDFSYENIRGMGTLSGEALKNAMILGYMKRDNRIEIYGELVKREYSLIIACLKYMHPDMAKELDELRVSYKFAEPFAKSKTEDWTAICNAVSSGVMSRETAIPLLGMVDNVNEEMDRILMYETEKVALQLHMKEEAEQQKQKEGE